MPKIHYVIQTNPLPPGHIIGTNEALVEFKEVEVVRVLRQVVIPAQERR